MVERGRIGSITGEEMKNCAQRYFRLLVVLGGTRNVIRVLGSGLACLVTVYTRAWVIRVVLLCSAVFPDCQSGKFNNR